MNASVSHGHGHAFAHRHDALSAVAKVSTQIPSDITDTREQSKLDCICMNGYVCTYVQFTYQNEHDDLRDWSVSSFASVGDSMICTYDWQCQWTVNAYQCKDGIYCELRMKT